MDMARVKAQAAPDALVLINNIPAGPFAVYGVDRAIGNAFAATVAFYIDIDLGPGLDQVNEAGGRAFMDRDNEIFFPGIIQNGQVVRHFNRAGRR